MMRPPMLARRNFLQLSVASVASVALLKSSLAVPKVVLANGVSDIDEKYSVLIQALRRASDLAVDDIYLAMNDSVTRHWVCSIFSKVLSEANSVSRLPLFLDFTTVCDERNNPPNVVDSGTVLAHVYFKPVRATFMGCYVFDFVEYAKSRSVIIDYNSWEG